MTGQNIQPKIESAKIESDSANRDRHHPESKEETHAKDTQVASQPEEKSSVFQQYCDSHPGASECRIYDV